MGKYHLSKNEIEEGINKSINQSIKLASKAKIVCQSEGENSSIGLGIYSLAIEEFGKACLLKDCIKTENDNEVNDDYFHASRAHNLKFQQALSNLPEMCTKFLAGIVVSSNTNIQSTVTKVGPNGEPVLIPESTTGKFTLVDKFPIDSKLRESCLYVDWDKDEKSWKSIPQLPTEDLADSIDEFLAEVDKFKKLL